MTLRAAALRVAVVGWAAGCAVASPPCEDLDRPSEARDRCYGDRALGAARAGDVPAATSALQEVDDPLLRAAAVDRVLTDGKGLGTTEAAALCKLLASPFDRNCADTWSRPHLWSGGGRPGTPPGPGQP
jgi:hypothetical protein